MGLRGLILIVEAETRGVVGHRVPQAGIEVDRAIDLTVRDRPRAGHRSPAISAAATVHAREDRIIRGAEPMPDGEAETRSRGAADSSM